jgi:hypothetical protein
MNLLTFAIDGRLAELSAHLIGLLWKPFIFGHEVGCKPAAKNKLGELRRIVIGNAKDGSLKAFIPDPSDLDKVEWGTSASGIAADDMGSVYPADVGTQNLRKYVKIR